MKEKRNLIGGMFLGLLMGWTLGFLRLPFLEQNASFWVGAVACLTFFAILFSILLVWNKRTFLSRLTKSKSNPSDVENTNKIDSSNRLLSSLLILVIALASYLWVSRQQHLFETQTQFLSEKIEQQADLIKNIESNNLILLMSSFLDKIEAELKSNSKDSLSDATIEKIADLSQSFKPYNYYEADSLSFNDLSPERGQLLLGLLKLKMDSSSFNSIKQRVTFAGADLRGANLSGLDLAGADFRTANFWGANLKQTNFKDALMTRAIFSWADLSEANLSSPHLKGANMNHATLVKANLSSATFKWGFLREAILFEANLTDCNLLETDLSKANLSHADLSESLLSGAILSEVNLTGTALEKSNCEPDWLERLKAWEPIGLEEILSQYSVVDDTVGRRPVCKFWLEKIKK